MPTQLGPSLRGGALQVDSLRVGTDDVGAQLAALQASVTRLEGIRPFPTRLHGIYLLVAGPAAGSGTYWASSLHLPDPEPGGPIFASPLRTGLTRANVANNSVHYGWVIEVDESAHFIHNHGNRGPYKTDDTPNTFFTISVTELSSTNLTWTIPASGATYEFVEASHQLIYTAPSGAVLTYAGPFPLAANSPGPYSHGTHVRVPHSEVVLRTRGAHPGHAHGHRASSACCTKAKGNATSASHTDQCPSLTRPCASLTK